MSTTVETGPLDTGPLDTGAPEPEPRQPALSSVRSTTPRQVWQTARAPLAIAGLILVLAAVVVANAGRVRGGFLRMDGTQPPGGRALAQLLLDRGIDVQRTPTVPATVDTTVFVPIPDLVDPASVADAALQRGSDIVVVGPSEDWLAAFSALRPDLTVRLSGYTGLSTREPQCSLDVATTAGGVQLGGFTYSSPNASAQCYPAGRRFTLLGFADGDARFTVVSGGAPFTNERLGEQGNAAFALGLLSRRADVAWVYPTPAELLGDEGEQKSLTSLLPQRVKTAVSQLGVVVVLLALWRVRRLGPPVVEPLPVAVRASETVDGRARLYQSAKATGRAAEALRRAARERLARRLGLRVDGAEEALVNAVARRTRRASAQVETLLYGAPPGDADALVRLAGDLDRLEREVHSA